jgi:hypothetical protein
MYAIDSVVSDIIDSGQLTPHQLPLGFPRRQCIQAVKVEMFIKCTST